jgi:hypothetical protein
MTSLLTLLVPVFVVGGVFAYRFWRSSSLNARREVAPGRVVIASNLVRSRRRD